MQLKADPIALGFFNQIENSPTGNSVRVDATILILKRSRTHKTSGEKLPEMKAVTGLLAHQYIFSPDFQINLLAFLH
jgi:hypothetical protein